MEDTAWIATARKYVGQKELAGPQNNPHVIKWWKDIGAPFKEDSVPWCGAFVGGVLSEVGIKPVAGGASAKAWLKLPVKLDKPAVGCVVVFNRPPNPGSGHVGFVVGKDQHGNLMVLGGNQGDAVNIKPFSTARVAGYRWPGIYPFEERFNLPVVNSDGRVSSNEA